MKTNVTAIIFSIIVIVISFSTATFANIAEETSINNTNMIAWANENEEDSPELAARVKELNKKWGTTSTDSKNYSTDSKNYSNVSKNYSTDSLDARLKAVDAKWAKYAQNEEDNSERLEKQEKREKEQREKEEELNKRLKEIDARYENI